MIANVMLLNVFFEQLRKEHPHLLLIINEDALSPNAPHIKDMKKYNLHYILGVKPGDHKFLFNFVEKAVQDGSTVGFTIKKENNPDKTHHFRILNIEEIEFKNRYPGWRVRNVDEITSPTIHHSFRPSSPDLKSQKY